MARVRYIKPGLCLNEALGTGPVEYQLVFACLPMLADRAGRLCDRPLRIKAEIFPYRAGDIDAALTWLHDRGFILRYEVGNAKYIQILQFERHQKPHSREAPSEIPEPPRQLLGTTKAVPRHDLGDAEPAQDVNGNGNVNGNVKGNGVFVSQDLAKQAPRAYQHPVMLAVKAKRGHIRWIGLEMGIEPPERQATEIALVDDLIKQFGQPAVIDAYTSATAGAVSFAEARKKAADYLHKQYPNKTAPRGDSPRLQYGDTTEDFTGVLEIDDL